MKIVFLLKENFLKLFFIMKFHGENPPFQDLSFGKNLKSIFYFFIFIFCSSKNIV